MQQLTASSTDLDPVWNATSGCGFQPTPGLRSVLFLAADAQDNAADAVRDTALDLGGQATRPVLLLDLAIPANRHYRAFYRAGRLLPRPSAASPAGGKFAMLRFDRVGDANLFVSRVTPDPSAFSEHTWRIAGGDGLRRLHQLFGAIVIAAPELDVSDAGLRLAPHVDGVVLVLRSGVTRVAAARLMRDGVLRAGGQILGTVLTQCSRRIARAKH